MVTVAISFDSSNEPMIVRLTVGMLDAATLNPATSGQPLWRRYPTRRCLAEATSVTYLGEQAQSRREHCRRTVLRTKHDLEDIFRGE